MSSAAVSQEANLQAGDSERFSQRVIDFGFFIGLFLAATGFTVAAFYLNTYLKSTDDILKSIADNPHLTDVGLSLLIQAKLVAAKDSLLSCGVLTGISTTLIGFCLFLILSCFVNGVDVPFGSGIDDLFKHHADEIGADDLANAKSAWRDQAVLKKVHSYVESAFSAPEDVANASDSVTRTVKGNALRPRLNQMLKKIPQPDLERVIGKDGVQSLYEIAKLTEKPEGLADMQNMIGQIASHGYITKIVKSPLEARNLVARYLATSPRVSHMAINALKFGTPAKVYAPIIANAIAESENK